MYKLCTFLALFISITSLSLAQTEIVKSSRNPIKETVNQKTFLPQDFQSVQGILFEDFNGDNTPAGLAARNWIFIDNDGEGVSTIYNGAFANTFYAYEGSPGGYAAQNFNGAFGGGFLIDQWLISSEFTVDSGNIVTFYWRAFGGAFDDSVYLKISDGGNTIPDFTQNLGRFRVPSSNWEKFNYEFTTSGTKRFAFQYYHTDGGPNGTHSNYWGLDYFHISSGPGFTTDPSPFDDELIANNNPTLSWTNPGGTTDVELFFGTSVENLISVYNGSAVTSYDTSSLNYATTYYWKVDASNSNGTTPGDIWSFTTGNDPLSVILFSDDFEAGFTNWTATTPNDICDWGFASDSIPGSFWGAPNFPGTASGNFIFASSDACGALMNVYLNGNFSVDLSQYQTVWIEFVSDFEVFSTPAPPDTARVDVSVDGGLTWTETFLRLADAPAEHVNQDISSLAGLQSDVRFRLVYYGDFSWHWAIDNFTVFATDIVPVELTSFTASVIGNKVSLDWQTATETNNFGFEIERKQADQQYTKVGFVVGFGTTTEAKNYNFIDNSVTSGSYKYRLKQIDFDGTVNYSSEVNAELNPTTYSLNQNYPNPFNPNTKIDFSIATDSKVTLKIFDVLGQEVITLINENLSTGVHSLNFNASGINSGVYFYTLEATGIDGTNFNSTKKMILTK